MLFIKYFYDSNFLLSILVFNGLRPLDLAADSVRQTKIQGDVHLLESIPFNYRERHPRLFEYGKYSNVQRTNPSGLPEPGINDDLIGMISHKKSLITIFGLKHKIIKKFDIFHEKNSMGIWILVHIWNQIFNFEAKILQK